MKVAERNELKEQLRGIEKVECPWPEDIWTMTDAEYVIAIPDPHLRTAVSGFLMRKGWEHCVVEIKKACE